MAPQLVSESRASKFCSGQKETHAYLLKKWILFLCSDTHAQIRALESPREAKTQYHPNIKSQKNNIVETQQYALHRDVYYIYFMGPYTKLSDE